MDLKETEFRGPTLLSEFVAKPQATTEPGREAALGYIKMLSKDAKMAWQLDDCGVLAEIREDYRLGLSQAARRFEFTSGTFDDADCDNVPQPVLGDDMSPEDKAAAISLSKQFHDNVFFADDPMFGRKRVVRVFVCSNYHDMKEERKLLALEVWPKLRRYCQKRGLHFSEVDFNWGSIESTAERANLYQQYLQELAMCQPYFVGMLGDRYGFTFKLGVETVKENTDPLRLIKKHVEAGLKDLEVVSGPLNNPSKWNHSFFYFRDPCYVDTFDEQEDRDVVKAETPGALELLNILKNKIRKSGHSVLEDYKSPKECVANIEKDIMASILKNFPEKPVHPPDWTSPKGLYDHWSHNEFEQKAVSKAWVSPQALDALNSHVLDARTNALPLVVVGESGIGSSSLLAAWKQHFEKVYSPTMIHAHYCGITAHDSWLHLVQRIVVALKGQLNLRQPLPVNIHEARNALTKWFQDISQSVTAVIVLVLDAVDVLSECDDFEYGANDPVAYGRLNWLPQSFPPCVRVVLSVTEGSATHDKLVNERGWPTHKTAPLTLDTRKSLLQEALNKYNVKFSLKQLTSAIDCSLVGNPLFLDTAVHCLSSQVTLSQLAKSVPGIEPDVVNPKASISEQIFGGATIATLADRVIARFDEAHQERFGLPEEVLSHLAMSRHGLEEFEIVAMLQVPRALWAKVRSGMTSFVDQTGNLYKFTHYEFREAAIRRHLPTEMRQHSVRQNIINYYRNRGTDERTVVELPFQLATEKLFLDLVTLLTDPSVFMMMRRSPAGRADLIWFCWLAMAEIAKGKLDILIEAFEEKVATCRARGNTEMERGAFMQDAAMFLLEINSGPYANSLMKRAIDNQTRVGVLPWDLARRLQAQVRICLDQRRREDALELHQQCLELTAHHLGVRHREYLRLRRDQMFLLIQCERFGRVADECTDMVARRAPGTREMGLEAARLAMHIHISQGRFDLAETLLLRMRDACPPAPDPTGAHATDFSDIRIAVLTEMVSFYIYTGQVVKATDGIEHERLLERLVDERTTRRLLGLLMLYGAALTQAGRTELADSVMKEVLAVPLAESKLIHRCRALDLTGFNMMMRGNMSLAEELHRQAVTIRVRLYGADHPIVSYSLSQLARLRETRYEFEQALELRLLCLRLWRGTQHAGAVLGGLRCLHALAALYWRFGMYRRADRDASRVVAAVEQTMGTTHPFMAKAATLAALCSIGLQNYEGARTSVQVALTSARLCWGANHNDYFDALAAKAILLEAEGDLEGQEAALRESADGRAAVGQVGYEFEDLMRLGQLFWTVGAVQETEIVARRCKELATQAYGDFSMHLTRSLVLLSVACDVLDIDDSVSMCEQALQARVRVAGTDSATVVQHRVLAALFLHGQGELIKAADNYKLGYASMCRWQRVSPARIGVYVNLWQVMQEAGDTMDHLPPWIPPPAPKPTRLSSLVDRRDTDQAELLTLVKMGLLPESVREVYIPQPGEAEEAQSCAEEVVATLIESVTSGEWLVAPILSALLDAVVPTPVVEDTTVDIDQDGTVAPTLRDDAEFASSLAIDTLIKAVGEHIERVEAAAAAKAALELQDLMQEGMPGDELLDILESETKIEVGMGSTKEATNALFQAVADEDGDAVSELAAAGLSMDSVDDEKNTALHIAAACDLPHMAALLLNLGASADMADAGLTTALHITVREQSPQLLRLLLPKVRNVDFKDAHGYTALHIAAQGGWMAAVRVLVEEGHASLKESTDDGNNAAHLAMKAGHISVMEYLKRRVEMNTEEGVTFDIDTTEMVSQFALMQSKDALATRTLPYGHRGEYLALAARLAAERNGGGAKPAQ